MIGLFQNTPKKQELSLDYLFVCLFVLPLFKEGDVITCYSFLTYGLLRAFYPANHDTPQKKDHNAGNYMSLRKVCGLFYVQQDYEH